MVIDEALIDTNVRELVAAMNEVEGIETTGSCGGHVDPGPCQYPAGEFSITFRVAWDERGHMGLEILAHSIYEPPPAAPAVENVNIDVGTNGDVFFALNGWNGSDPDVMAKAIRETNAAFQREDVWG